jgi:biopolymer transport protein ExbD
MPSQLFIEADERVPNGKLVEIMDLATNAGL